MYARVTTIQISPYRVDDAIGVLKEQVVPTIQQQTGFKGYLMFVDRSTGKSINVTLWDEEADREVTGSNSSYYREAIGKVVPLLTDVPYPRHDRSQGHPSPTRKGLPRALYSTQT